MKRSRFSEEQIIAILSGVRVARELTRLIGMRGKPHTVVSDNGTELTSSAILRRSPPLSRLSSFPAILLGFRQVRWPRRWVA